jgi:predicted phosphodiesterase
LRIALFSDVHGNAVAFDAFLADFDRHVVDQVVCLGDHAQGGSQPSECLERLRELGCPAVLGNSDHFLLTLDPGDEAVTEAQLETARWSASQLSEELLDFHRSFQPTVELDLGDGRSLLAFHGTPRSRDEIIGPWMEEEAFREPFDGANATILAGGHIHQQWARRLGNRYFVNPGSVGLAYDHRQPEESFRADPFAEYAVVTADGDSTGVEFRRVPFDGGEVLRAIEESGMPQPERAARLWRQRATPT